MQSLTQLQRGKRGVVSAINGDTHFLGRITSIGLTVGCSIEVLKNEKRQPVLLYSRDTMIAINRKEGEKIMLEAGA
jgi:ferrous iron transport protein A